MIQWILILHTATVVFDLIVILAGWLSWLFVLCTAVAWLSSPRLFCLFYFFFYCIVFWLIPVSCPGVSGYGFVHFPGAEEASGSIQYSWDFGLMLLPSVSFVLFLFILLRFWSADFVGSRRKVCLSVFLFELVWVGVLVYSNALIFWNFDF